MLFHYDQVWAFPFELITIVSGGLRIKGVRLRFMRFQNQRLNLI